VTWWQGRGLLYWVSKSKGSYLRKDLLVRGIELGPVSYRRRPSTSCQPAFAESLGYVATIAGLEYFSQEVPSDLTDDDKVRLHTSFNVSPVKAPGTNQVCGAALGPDAYLLNCPELRHGERESLV
jgi:hypothetical protein